MFVARCSNIHHIYEGVLKICLVLRMQFCWFTCERYIPRMGLWIKDLTAWMQTKRNSNCEFFKRCGNDWIFLIRRWTFFHFPFVCGFNWTIFIIVGFVHRRLILLENFVSLRWMSTFLDQLIFVSVLRLSDFGF